MLTSEIQLCLAGGYSLKSKFSKMLDKHLGSISDVRKPKDFNLSDSMSLTDFQKVFNLIDGLWSG